jgi:MFS transporter, ACS family, glucarate transporter
MIFPVRWRIFALLFGFGCLAYVQQKSITVAAAQMMPILHFSKFQISFIEWAFVLGYGLLQLPGGVFGQRKGARASFVIFGLVAFIATVAMPASPYMFQGSALYVALFLSQFVLGCSQAGLFPVSSGVFEVWFPPRWWSGVQGLQTAGLSLGAALTPPLITGLMVQIGWQQALLWTSLPALALIAVWAWYGRNSPREHPGMTPRELEVIGRHTGAPVDAQIDWHKLMRMLRNRNVLLLALSYLCLNYSFYLISNWTFLYLTDERHLTLRESGFLAVAPPLAAALGAGIGGLLTAAAIKRRGNRWGYRFMPLTALPVAAGLLLISAYAGSAYVALFGLAACFFVIELCEGAYWGGAMTVGRGDTMAVSGVMNTGGNLGGMICLPIVGHLADEHLWHSAFWLGVGFALAGAVAWLWIEVDHPAADAEPDEGGMRA